MYTLHQVQLLLSAIMSPRSQPHTALLSNLLPYLSSCPHVKITNQVSGSPCTSHKIIRWELENAVQLPTDLKDFLIVCNGMKLEWGFQSRDHVVDVGRVEIRPVEDWEKLDCGGLGTAWCFQDCPGFGKVCLVYDSTKPAASIYFLESSTKKYYVLAASFTAYFRLLVVHMGVLGWQMAWTEQGLRQGTMDWLALFAPKRLRRDKVEWVEAFKRCRPAVDGDMRLDVPFDAERVKQAVADMKVGKASPKKKTSSKS